MQAEGSVAGMAGVPVQRVSARIGYFKSPVLEMDYRAEAPLPDMVGFVGRTPLLDNVGQLVREKTPPRGVLRCVLARIKCDVVADGECPRCKAAGRRRGGGFIGKDYPDNPSIGVDPLWQHWAYEVWVAEGRASSWLTMAPASKLAGGLEVPSRRHRRASSPGP